MHVYVCLCLYECPLLQYAGSSLLFPHTAMTTFLIFQTKDKMCDIIDTTYLYPFTTTIVARTTPRSKEATAGGDTPSTSHPPTSVPTEGKVEKSWNEATVHIVWEPRAFIQVVMDALLWQDVK